MSVGNALRSRASSISAVRESTPSMLPTMRPTMRPTAAAVGLMALLVPWQGASPRRRCVDIRDAVVAFCERLRTSTVSTGGQRRTDQLVVGIDYARSSCIIVVVIIITAAAVWLRHRSTRCNRAVASSRVAGRQFALGAASTGHARVK